MILHRLLMQNYRVFEEPTEIVFDSGLVGIHGVNGAGKSSLIGAIPWALYGHLSTKVGLARTSGTLGPCIVELEFEHEGHLYRVVREVSGDLAMPHTTAAAYADGNQVSVGVRNVNAYIESVLGMSQSAFLASVFTEQKQLAAFSSRQPRERAELVVNLLGVKPLDTAIASARAEARKEEAIASELTATVQDVTALAAAVEVAKAAVERHVVVLERHEAELVAAEARAEHARAELGRLRERASQFDSANRRHQRVTKEIGVTQQSAQRLRAEIASLDAAVTELAELDIARPDPASLQARSAELRRYLDAVERLREGPPPAGPSADLVEEHQTALRDANAQVKERAAELDHLQLRASTATERARHAQEVLDAARGLDTSAPCPTCGQALGASFSEVCLHMSTEAATYSDQAKNLAADARAARAALAQAQEHAGNALATWHATSAALERATEAGLRWERDRAQVEAVYSHAAAVWAQHGSQLDEFDPNAEMPPDRWRADQERALTALASEFKALTTRERRIGELRSAVAARAAHDEHLREVVQREELLSNELEETLRELEAIDFDPASLDVAQKASGEADRGVRAGRAGAEQARQNVAAARTDHGHAEGKLEQAVRTRDLVSERTASARELARVAKLLQAFRVSVTGAIGKVLATNAQQLFLELTDGEYEGLAVDATTYDMTIRDSGVWHPLERFSGSEQDLANLALRVAISEHVRFQSGGTVGLLVLDEVFGALDAQRREQMLVALERLQSRFRQILVVTHADDVKDQLPSSIEVEKLPGRRSRIS